MPGASAATQSSLCSSKPNDPWPVSATMSDTPASSAKISVGSRILRCMGGHWFRLAVHFRSFRRLGLLLRIDRSGRLFCFPDGANHVERALGIILELIPQNAFTAVEGVFQAYGLSFDSAEFFGGEKW